MKKKYMTPEIELAQLETEDIVTASNDGWNPDEDSTEIIGGW